MQDDEVYERLQRAGKLSPGVAQPPPLPATYEALRRVILDYGAYPHFFDGRCLWCGVSYAAFAHTPDCLYMRLHEEAARERPHDGQRPGLTYKAPGVVDGDFMGMYRDQYHQGEIARSLEVII